MAGRMIRKLTQLLKCSLRQAPTFLGAGGLLLISTLGWADGHPSTQVDSSPSWGSQSGSSAETAGPKKRPGSNPNAQLQDLSTNEQARIYQRANENLITQTVYLEQNLESVKELRDKLDGDSPNGLTDDDKLKIPVVTSQFCSSDIVDTKEGARACLDQFRELRVAQLRELQEGIVKNDDSQARLQNERG